jgi:hypothetical protein
MSNIATTNYISPTGQCRNLSKMPHGGYLFVAKYIFVLVFAPSGLSKNGIYRQSIKSSQEKMFFATFLLKIHGGSYSHVERVA